MTDKETINKLRQQLAEEIKKKEKAEADAIHFASIYVSNGYKCEHCKLCEECEVDDCDGGFSAYEPNEDAIRARAVIKSHFITPEEARRRSAEYWERHYGSPK